MVRPFRAPQSVSEEPAVPINTDPQSLTEWILAVFGIGGGGYKIVTHDARIKRLEDDRKADVKKIDETARSMSEMKGTLDQVSDTVMDIRNLLMRGK